MTKIAPVEKKTDRPLVIFTTAFALGALLTYFTTPAGKRTWQKLSREWDKAREDLHRQGLLPDANLSLDQFKQQYLAGLGQSFFAVKDSFEEFLQQAESMLQAKKAAKKQKSKLKFKGIKSTP